jgi:hypothetical protein
VRTALDARPDLAEAFDGLPDISGTLTS